MSLSSMETMDERGDVPSQQCSNCDGSLARCWCLDCNEALCDDCVSAHRRVTLTRWHRLLNQASDDSGFIPPTKFCKLHPSEVLKLFCLTCVQLTCRDCQLESHQNHRFCFVSGAVDSCQKQLDAYMQLLRGKMEASARSLQDMETRLKILAHCEFVQTADLQRVLKTFVQLLKRRVEVLFKEIQKVYESERQMISEKMLAGKRLQETHRALRDAAEKARNTSDPQVLMSCIDQMKPRVKDLVDQDLSPPPNMANLRIVTDSTFLEGLLNFGKLEVLWVPFSVSEKLREGKEKRPTPSVSSSSSSLTVTPPTTSSQPLPSIKTTSNRIFRPVSSGTSSTATSFSSSDFSNLSESSSKTNPQTGTSSVAVPPVHQSSQPLSSSSGVCPALSVSGPNPGNPPISQVTSVSPSASRSSSVHSAICPSLSHSLNVCDHPRTTANHHSVSASPSTLTTFVPPASSLRSPGHEPIPRTTADTNTPLPSGLISAPAQPTESNTTTTTHPEASQSNATIANYYGSFRRFNILTKSQLELDSGQFFCKFRYKKHRASRTSLSTSSSGGKTISVPPKIPLSSSSFTSSSCIITSSITSPTSSLSCSSAVHQYPTQTVGRENSYPLSSTLPLPHPALPPSLSSYISDLSSPVHAVPSFSSAPYHFLPQTFASTGQPLTSIPPPVAGPNPLQSSLNLNPQPVPSQNQPPLAQLNTENVYPVSGSGLNRPTVLPQFPVPQNGSALHSESTVQKNCVTSQFSLDSLVPQAVLGSTTENVHSVTQCCLTSNQQTQTNKSCAPSDGQVLSHQNQTSNSRPSLQQNLQSKMVAGSNHSVQDPEVQQESEVDKRPFAVSESTIAEFRGSRPVQKLSSPETLQIIETAALSEETDPGEEQLPSKIYQVKQSIISSEEINLIVGPFSPPPSDIQLTITSLEETDPPGNQSSSKAHDAEPVSTKSEKTTCFDGLISPVSSDDELTIVCPEKTNPTRRPSSPELDGTEGVTIKSEETETCNRPFSPISSDGEAIVLSEETKPTRRWSSHDVEPITDESKENNPFGGQGSPSEETDPPGNRCSPKAHDAEPVSTKSEKTTCFDGLISPVSSDDELTIVCPEKTNPRRPSSLVVDGTDGVTVRSEETEMSKGPFSPISSDDEAIILSEETKPTQRCFSREVDVIEEVTVRSEETEMGNGLSPVSSEAGLTGVLSEETEPIRRWSSPKVKDVEPITNESKENKPFGGQGSSSEETDPPGNRSSSKAHDAEPVSTKSERNTCFKGLISPVSSDDELTIVCPEKTNPTGRPSSPELDWTEDGTEGVTMRSEETEMSKGPFSPISSDDEAIILSEETKPRRRWSSQDVEQITDESKENNPCGGQGSPSEETDPPPETYDELIPAKSDQTKVGRSSFSPGSSDDESTNASSEENNLALNLSSSETLDSEDEDPPSPKTNLQDFSQPQWQPTVSLVRLPVSGPRQGSPLPSFHFILGETKEEIFLQEYHVNNNVSDATNDDFIICPSSPESPLSVEVIFCSACSSANACKICSDCGRGYHNDCHVPPVGPDIWSEWICSLCQDLADPSDPYGSDRTQSPGSTCLSLQDQRRCETLLLHLKVEGCGQFSELEFWTDLMLVSERLTHRCPPPYQTAAQLVADLWTLFPDASQDDALLKLQQSFQKKLVEVLGGELHPSLLMTPLTNDPVPSSNDDGSPNTSASSNILQNKNKKEENFSSGSKLNDLRKRLRDFLVLNRTSAPKRTKKS